MLRWQEKWSVHAAAGSVFDDTVVVKKDPAAITTGGHILETTLGCLESVLFLKRVRVCMPRCMVCLCGVHIGVHVAVFGVRLVCVW